jgi:hypothetical protein
MPTYDPLTSEVTTDATINSVVYIVTDFNDPGATAVGPDFQNSDGSYRNARRVTGPRDASMTIEVENAAETGITQFVTFSYKGSTWSVFQVGKAMSSTGAATIPLSLRWVSTP